MTTQDTHERGRASAEEYMPDDLSTEAAAVSDILDEYAQAAEKAGRALLKLRAVEQFIAPVNDDRFGYLPGKFVQEDDVIASMLDDARGNMVAWLKSEIRKEMGE